MGASQKSSEKLPVGNIQRSEQVTEWNEGRLNTGNIPRITLGSALTFCGHQIHATAMRSRIQAQEPGSQTHYRNANAQRTRNPSDALTWTTGNM